ncbi:17-beta-hydroxysteroid dehydrogenase 13-like [Wyeomyia smithii]|uniref:17-beta-hydroxysteroid dehydrogenase 13-like n=1 Tax=Wyeomyia smithii TaxID=174621 RepID=UPI002467D4B1|nr:17-beta-hydroxysteroid dehydrogenase 13-like [Wyeomyia smithii]
MALEGAYFTHSDGLYEAAERRKAPRCVDSGKRLQKKAKFILLELIPMVIKLVIVALPGLLRDLLRTILPARHKSIANQVALVTGGGNGLGRALCLRLAQDGCSVAVADIDLVSAQKTAEEIRQRFGKPVDAFRVDVGDYGSVQQLRKDVERSLGPVDILVNNAGLLAMLSLSEGKAEDIRRIIDVNLMAHFWTIREFKEGMVERGRGHIVAICSMFGIIPCGRTISYTTTKFGVKGLMAALKEEIYMDDLSDCIHTTCVYPAGVATRKEFVDFVQSLSKIKIPWNSPESVANMVVDAVRANKAEIVPSHFMIKLLTTVFPLIPTALVHSTVDVCLGTVPKLTK